MVPPSGVAAAIDTPFPRHHSMASALDASATGRLNNVPILAQTTFGLKISVQASQTITAAAADNAIVRVSESALAAFSDLTADSPLELATSGASDSGVASITLVIDWY